MISFVIPLPGLLTLTLPVRSQLRSLSRSTSSRIQRSQKRVTMAVIEVERKFQITADAKQKILSFENATVTPTESIIDQYYNDQLALSDKWLRKRNGRWELKLPINDGATQHDNAGTHASGLSVFRELYDTDVWSALSLPPPPSDSAQIDMVCFATLATERTTVVIPWQTRSVKVTFDECTSPDGFQCNIGELELIVTEQQQVTPATLIINHLIAHFQLSSVDTKDGKLTKFLKHHRPAMFKELLLKYNASTS